MGIYSRDYVRESTGRGGGWGDDTPACKRLIIITVAAFIGQLVIPPLTDLFALQLADVRRGQVWQLVTCAFLHSPNDVWHLAFNMLGLWWFGAEMERLYGSKEFTVFYLAAAVASSLGFIGWQAVTGNPGQALGASGAVMAAMTLYATHYPREKIGVMYGLFFIEVRWVVAIYALVDLVPVLRTIQGENVATGVAHASHLLGMVFGFLYRHYHWHLSSWFDLSFLQSLPRRWRQTRVKKNLRVFAPESEGDLEGELDRILAKIHDHGSASLTEREQAILSKASQQYKKRP